MTRAVLKSNAKAQLKGKWGLAIVTLIVALLVITGFSSIIGIIEPSGGILTVIGRLVSILLGGVATLGIARFSLKIVNNREQAQFNDLLWGFNIYLKTLGLWILMTIAIVIGMILLIVPGIIIALMFSQAFFILCEDNNKSISQCLKESMNMMNGHKVDLFVLNLSFIGWWIVAIITLGLGTLFVYPYQQITLANYYIELKEK